MAAVELLCQIIAQAGQANTADFRNADGYAELLQAGFIVEKGVVQSVLCDDCSDPHDAKIDFEAESYGWHCPEIGFVAAQRSDLVAVKPDLSRIVASLVKALECKAHKSTPLHGTTWRVGKLSSHKGDLSVYFHPSLHTQDDMERLNAALSREVKTAYRLVIVASGTLLQNGCALLNLCDAVELHDGAFHVSCDVRRAAGIPSVNRGGRKEEFGARLTIVYERRKQAGIAKEGLNEEAKAAIKQFIAENPDADVPHLSTSKRHLTKFRAGS